MNVRAKRLTELVIRLSDQTARVDGLSGVEERRVARIARVAAQVKGVPSSLERLSFDEVARRNDVDQSLFASTDDRGARQVIRQQDGPTGTEIGISTVERVVRWILKGAGWQQRLSVQSKDRIAHRRSD